MVARYFYALSYLNLRSDGGGLELDRAELLANSLERGAVIFPLNLVGIILIIWHQT